MLPFKIVADEEMFLASRDERAHVF
jgi:hypothetical protein